MLVQVWLQTGPAEVGWEVEKIPRAFFNRDAPGLRQFLGLPGTKSRNDHPIDFTRAWHVPPDPVDGGQGDNADGKHLDPRLKPRIRGEVANNPTKQGLGQPARDEKDALGNHEIMVSALGHNAALS